VDWGGGTKFKRKKLASLFAAEGILTRGGVIWGTTRLIIVEVGKLKGCGEAAV